MFSRKGTDKPMPKSKLLMIDMLIIVVGTFLYAILGAFIAFVVIFLVYSSNPVVRDEEGFREHIGIEVIGTVPDFAASKKAEKRINKHRL